MSGGINLKELQFLSLYGVDNDFSMIPEKEKDNFLKILKKYFEKHGVDHELEIKEYKDKEAVYKVKRTGILLNQKQIRHLVKVVFQRVKMIRCYYVLYEIEGTIGWYLYKAKKRF